MNQEMKRIRRDLHGFTLEARVKAKCPSGHSLILDMEVLIPPTDNLDTKLYVARLEQYIKAAYYELSHHSCEVCATSVRTGWR